MLTRTYHQIDNGDGWLLRVRQVVDDERYNKRFRPLVIIPGYGMNSHILGYHPAGRPLEAFLAEAGFEVWCANLRTQEGTVRLGGTSRADYTMKDLAHDAGASIAAAAVKLGASALFVGTTQRGAVWRLLRGNVLKVLIRALPDSVRLVIVN